MTSKAWPPMRIGTGSDVHALVPGRKLILGGIHVPYSMGLLGHSDADALLHAITDAFLGSLALGDIGQWFPDSDPRWQGADSMRLLTEAHNHVRQLGWRPANIDTIITAQAPKLAPFVDAMRANIARQCDLDIDQVSIKAKTAERLGALGRREGIAVQAIVLLVRE